MISNQTKPGTEKLRFLTESQVRRVAAGGTPAFVYSRGQLRAQAEQALEFKAPFGLKVRFAMKANPHPEIIKLFYGLGIWIDASSGPEAEHAIACGVRPEHILLTTQELPDNLDELIKQGVKFNASSLHQLETYCKLAPGSEVSVRINPGMGTGSSRQVTTGGELAAFGIWHEYMNKVNSIAASADVTIAQVHTHVGSGTNPDEWLATAHLTLDLMAGFKDATTMSLGGGFKVGRMSFEHSADMAQISERISQLLEDYAQTSKRQLKLEIEPGTFLTANAGTLITRIIDKKDTGAEGYQFLLINSGMNDILRPSLYGALHPLVVVPKDPDAKRGRAEYIVPAIVASQLTS